MWYIIACVFVTMIASSIGMLLAQKNNHLKETLESNKKLQESYDKCEFYLKENIELKKIVAVYEEEKYSKIETFITCNGEIKKDPIYKGKRVLIGDYLSTSYLNTERVLRSLGFSVDIVPNIKDVVDKIKYGEHYDIIFSNNFYHDGNGQKCLEQLKSLKDFNTPVVIHTVDKDKREFFVDQVGFDDYIVKPVSLENVKPILERLLKK